MSTYFLNKAFDTLVIEEVLGKRVIKIKNQNESNGKSLVGLFISINILKIEFANQEKGQTKSTMKAIIQNKN